MVAERPVRITYIDGDVPVMAEIPDFDLKTFTIDNSFIHIVAKSTDIHEINPLEFQDWCLKNGFKASY